MLWRQGFVYQRTSTDPGKPACNSLLIASRWPLRRVRPSRAVAGPDEPNRWLPVHVQAPRPLLIAAMHIPTRISGRKYQYLTSTLNLARHWGLRRAILIGDTNSGIPGIDEESPAFNQTEGGWMRGLEKLGWRDAFRHHVGRRRAFTWYSPNGDNGFRLDQAFLSPGIAPELQRATHRWGGGSRRSGVSDHAAVIVDLADALT